MDHWLFNRLHHAGYSIYVLDAALPHELSVRSMRDVPIARYKNILSAEALFYSTCKSETEQKLYLLRLVGRVVRLLLRGERWELVRATLNHVAQLVLRGNMTE